MINLQLKVPCDQLAAQGKKLLVERGNHSNLDSLPQSTGMFHGMFVYCPDLYGYRAPKMKHVERASDLGTGSPHRELLILQWFMSNS